jgi:CHRD domain/Immunoglobulin domain
MIAASLLAVLLSASPLWAQPTGQWDFESGNLAATVGANMQYLDGPGGATAQATMFNTTTFFGIPDIGGSVAHVMNFPAAEDPMGYAMPTPANANGGGSLVNDYTLILDVLYPPDSDGLVRPIIQTDDAIITPEADLIVTAANGVGASGGASFGEILPNTWYRMGFVVKGSAQEIHFYINGAEVGLASIPDAFDSRFALLNGSTVAILNNTDTNSAPGYVNSIQIRDVALTAGQMQALGGPDAGGIPQTIPSVPSFIESRSPGIDATGVHPLPQINVVLNRGDTTVDTASIKLQVDGNEVAATVTPSGDIHTITYDYPTILRALTKHTLSLTYSDSAAGLQTYTWSFTVASYPTITLPSPIVIETFDTTAEGSLPPGWMVTNHTELDVAGLNLDDPTSDSYRDWVVISRQRVINIGDAMNWDANRRLNVSLTVVNGEVVSNLVSGNFCYAESDQRGGSQVQALFSPDFDMTGQANVFVSFHSIYEQNQDSIASVEYSIDGGATWLPVLYMVDQDDLIRDGSGNIDAVATLNTIRNDTAYGTSYGDYIGAPISQALAPYISGRVNDDPVESKRVELYRLPAADGQATVRFRFMQAGTASWYFGIDDFGLYSINTPVITSQPQSLTVDAGTPATFTVTATGPAPITYQWQHDGVDIPGATDSTLTIPAADTGDVGLYTVDVSNGGGTTPSSSAQLTVITVPEITVQPVSPGSVSPGATVTLSVTARGRVPLSYRWQHDSKDINGATDRVLTLSNVQAGDAGEYQVFVSNTDGMTNSVAVQLAVFGGAVSDDLVVHLKFDNDAADSSGHNNNGTLKAQDPVTYPGFDALPTFVSGGAEQIGTDAIRLTAGSYVNLGQPADLQFGSDVNFSLSFWVRGDANAWTGDPSFIGNKNWTSGGNQGFVVAAQGSGGWKWNYAVQNVGRQDTPNFAGSGGVIADGNWHNIVVTHDRAGLASFYFDGRLLSMILLTVAGNIDSFDINVGEDGTGKYGFANDTGARWVEVFMDDVGIWRRLVTPQEAEAIYNAGLFGNDLSSAAVGGPVLAPTITGQPQSVVTSDGGSASFSVTVTGGAPLSYQWRFNDMDIPGANGSTLSFSEVGSGDVGSYTVFVSNPGGSATSDPATLSIVSVPVITAQPQSLTLNQNLDVTLSVTATGGTLTYQWQHDGVDIPGATGSTLAFESIQPSQGGTYTVVVSNSQGSTPSDSAVLTVNPVGPIRVTGQWDFNNGDLSASCGNDLEAYDAQVTADTSFGTTTDFGIPDINGEAAHVLKFAPTAPFWGGYKMFHGAAPNGGGAYVNEYTIIYDILYPPSSDASWRSFLQTNTGNGNDGDFFVNPGNGIGISNNYQGTVTANAWHRIVFAVDCSGPAVAKFIDGVKVGYQALDGLDGRWSLDPFALLIGDNDGDNNVGYLSSVQFRNGKMSDAVIQALGTPTAGKIPGCISIATAGADLAINWTGGGFVTLQKKTNLSDPNWEDVMTTDAGTATIQKTDQTAFFRVVPRMTFTADISGDNERPTPVSPAGTGSGTFTLDGNKLTVDISYTGMTSPVSAAHIHGPATTEQSAGVLIGIAPALGPTGSTSGTFSGVLNLTTAIADDIVQGLTYVNIHTTNNGSGESRGQIVQSP